MTYLPETKICSLCKQRKTQEEFSFNNCAFDGLHHCCKNCDRNVKLQRSHNITLKQFELMLKSQNDVCAICGQSEKTVRLNVIIPLSVDHNHQTSKIRGLLCNNCNRGLSCFKDSPELLEKATKYLRKHQ